MPLLSEKISKSWGPSFGLSSNRFGLALHSLAQDLVATLSETYALAHGGYEYDGQPLTALDEEELRGILASWRGEVEAIAVIGVFFFKNDQELFVQALAKEVLGSRCSCILLSMIGSVGLIERENATILNLCVAQSN